MRENDAQVPGMSRYEECLQGEPDELLKGGLKSHSARHQSETIPYATSEGPF